MRLRCLEPPRDEDDDDNADKDDDDDEDSSSSGTSLTLARFSGETSLSDSEAGDTNKHMHSGGEKRLLAGITVLNNCNSVLFKVFIQKYKFWMECQCCEQLKVGIRHLYSFYWGENLSRQCNYIPPSHPSTVYCSIKGNSLEIR